MAYRTVVDESGVRWEVWAVRLQSVERRTGRERRVRAPGLPGDEVLDLVGRRRADRRRLNDHNAPRPRVPERFAGGWLAFESPSERRRLAPIPPAWEGASDEELLAMCERATVPVPRVRAGP